MKLLFGQDRLVAHWIAERIPAVQRRMHEAGFGEAFGPGSAIGVVDEKGVLLGGVVYHGYDPYCKSIELSFASDNRRWLSRDIIRALMSYPFVQLGCARITGITPKKAKGARVFLDKFGFKREGVIRRGFGNDDAIVSGLLKREWEAHRYFLRSTETPSTAPIIGGAVSRGPREFHGQEGFQQHAGSA